MAKRSHNETFNLLRNNAQKNRSFYKDFSKDDERVNLVGATEDEDIGDFELTTLDDNGHGRNDIELRDGNSFPGWISSLDEFRYETFNIRNKIEQLKKVQEEHLKQQATAIFADEVMSDKLRDHELGIERRCQELNVLFNRLHAILTHFQTVKATRSSNRLVSSILKNIFQYQVQEVVSLTQMFRSCQRIYLTRQSEATKVNSDIVITFDENLLNDDFVDASLIDNSFGGDLLINHEDNRLQRQTQLAFDDQLQLEMDINAQLRDKEKDMNSILKSFAELNQIFQEVNALVIDQGSALDRIDYNIEQVEHRVELGAISLEKAHRHISRMRKFKLILGVGLFMFILFLIIVLRS